MADFIQDLAADKDAKVSKYQDLLLTFGNRRYRLAYPGVRLNRWRSCCLAQCWQ